MEPEEAHAIVKTANGTLYPLVEGSIGNERAIFVLIGSIPMFVVGFGQDIQAILHKAQGKVVRLVAREVLNVIEHKQVIGQRIVAIETDHIVGNHVKEKIPNKGIFGSSAAAKLYVKVA